MKTYGIEQDRHSLFDCPDAIDCIEFAVKSSKSRVRGKGGDFKNSVRNVQAKQNSRRVFKKRARSRGKQQIQQELREEESNAFTNQ